MFFVSAIHQSLTHALLRINVPGLIYSLYSLVGFMLYEWQMFGNKGFFHENLSLSVKELENCSIAHVIFDIFLYEKEWSVRV